MVLRGAARSNAKFDPALYRRWYGTTLGSCVDADEKAVLFALADLKPGEQVLDIGCGDGNFTGPAAERAGCAVGLDRSAAMLRAAESRLGAIRRIRWVQSDAGNLPFPDASFDVVLMVTVLCFSDNPQAVVNEAFRVLRPGGRLVLGELGRYSTWAAIRRFRSLLGSATWRAAHFFPPRELGVLLHRAGMVDVVLRGAVYYPPLRASRLLRMCRWFEACGQRLFPWAGAFLAVRGLRPPA